VSEVGCTLRVTHEDFTVVSHLFSKYSAHPEILWFCASTFDQFRSKGGAVFNDREGDAGQFAS